MQEKFYLTEKLPPYIFAAMGQLKSEAAKKGTEIIDFGMGNPDLPPPIHVMENLAQLSTNPKLFGYSATGGIDLLKKAICDYYSRRFNVDLEYESQSLVTIGAKEGVASLATAISDSHNHIVLASPAYPIHTFAFEIAKSNVKHLEAINGYDFLKVFKEYVTNTKTKPVAVIVSFPGNPTTEIVGLDFYEELVAFCKKHQIYIISDIAYCELYFRKEDKPHSILEVGGAKDIAIEFSSVSKSYSMAGCRVGFAVGNATLIAALNKIKSYLDYGSFTPLQMVAAEALSAKSDQYLDDIRQTYHKRAKFMVEIFKNELGWEISMPKASMFIWTKLPEKFKNLSSFDFCRMLIEKTGVVMSPGSSFGKNGEGFVRISLIHNENNVKKAVAKLRNIL